MHIKTDIIPNLALECDIGKLSHFELALCKEPTDEIPIPDGWAFYDSSIEEEGEVIANVVVKHHD